MKAASRVGVALLLYAMLAGCAGGSTGEAAAPVAATAPPDSPAGWAWVGSDDGRLWLSLPPWLQSFDTHGAIFANEPLVGEGLQLLAEGRVEPQPPVGEVERWLTERVASPGAGRPTVERVDLPAGPAMRLHRRDRAGTPLAWELEAWAIGTPTGVAFLMVDGPPGAWEARYEEVRRIATLLRVTPPPVMPDATANGWSSRTG